MDRHVTWLGLAGSLRTGSYNRALLRAACELAPPLAHLNIFDLAEVPLYNGDLDNDEDRPESVRRLKQAIALADGVILASPEYNYGVPGVMKNAIDWASRPAFDSVLTRKPVAIIGASIAATGSVRAQQGLREVLLGCLCMVYPAPDIAVARAREKFAGGVLTDQDTREQLEEFLAGFAEFTDTVTQDIATDIADYGDEIEPTTRSMIERLSAG